ncbi:HNH endonuclease [Burkholderia seminalis]|uniref:HNH endonuclease n=1 Tax=Burkholderia seminalis TaxID=488731 RepID=UPI00264C39DE|nr:HNH endonuclease [Burkholderia seminalis]MDN7591846.1 HNH endonuclease [Burkholderia seminalis]
MKRILPKTFKTLGTIGSDSRHAQYIAIHRGLYHTLENKIRMKNKFDKFQIQTGAGNELLVVLNRFIYDRPMQGIEEWHFPDIPLKEYALASVTIEGRTALHKVLYDLAYVDFYLYAFDDVDFAPELLEEFRAYVTWIFREMRLPVPSQFSSDDPDVVRAARNACRDTFIEGLHTIVDSAYALAWHRKTLLYDFNQRLASTIRPLRKADYSILESDGRLPRATRYPSWLVNAVQKRDRGLCQHCGVPVTAVLGSDSSPHLDHLVALALGGGNDPTNLMLSCGPCNLSKGARPAEIRDEFSWPNARP